MFQKISVGKMVFKEFSWKIEIFLLPLQKQ